MTPTIRRASAAFIAVPSVHLRRHAPHHAVSICAPQQSARHTMSRAPLSPSRQRVNYSSSSPLSDANLPADPFALFGAWFADATAAKEKEPNAMCLATADADGRPSARMVLLKAFDERGFVWYTNYGSRKASNLTANPFAALTFWWAGLERSVRIEGVVERVSEAESDAYFESRPPESRLGALASDQSSVVDSRQMLEDKWERLQKEYLSEDGALLKEIQRPPRWGGYRCIPDRIEFWKGRSARLHDRIVYQANADTWTTSRLQP